MERSKVYLEYVEVLRREMSGEEKVRTGGVTAYDCCGYQWVVGC